jgi:DNA-binding LacI/PurR family transcriptional regulator
MDNSRVRASVTIREVARLAEVHPGTVSRALNEQTRALVNEETAERVLRAAAQLGYRPNRIARGLKTNRSYTISPTRSFRRFCAASRTASATLGTRC